MREKERKSKREHLSQREKRDGFKSILFAKKKRKKTEIEREFETNSVVLKRFFVKRSWSNSLRISILLKKSIQKRRERETQPIRNHKSSLPSISLEKRERERERCCQRHRRFSTPPF